MTESVTFELEDDPRPARLARRRRLATRAAAVAVPALLVAGLLGVVVHDGSPSDSRVAAAGTHTTVPEVGTDIVTVIEMPTTVTTGAPLPVEAPKPTMPKLPRLPAVTVPPVPPPPGIPWVPPVCPTTPPAYEPPPELGTYEIPAAGGTGRMVMPWTESTYVQDHTYAPDGAQIAYVRGWTDDDGQTPPKMYIADANFGAERHVAAEARLPAGLSWAPDGRHIAFLAQPEGSPHQAVHVLEPATGRVRQVSGSDVNGVTFPKWSRDGARLAWGGGWTSNTETGLWVAEVAATIQVAKIVDDPVFSIDWSPDGDRLAFSRYLGGAFVVDRDRTNRRALHPEGTGVAWSPTDRSRLVVDVKGALYRADPDTGATGFLAGGSAIGWLPDGSRLATGSPQGITLVGWDGCVQTVVTGDAIALRAWSPDSRRLLFVRSWPYSPE